MLTQVKKVSRWILCLTTVLLITTVFAYASAPGNEGDWWFSVCKTLTHPLVATFLLVLGILGIMVEMVTWSAVAGLIAIMSFTLFFLSHCVAGTVTPWVIVIFILGLALLGIEAFVIPGWGVTGTLGLIMITASLFSTMMLTNGPVGAGISVFIAMLISSVIFYFILKYLPKSKMWQRLTLQNTQSKEQGFVAVEKRVDLEGALGVTVTDLRPVGSALINGEKVDVIAEGGLIKKDTPIRVKKVEGMKITVTAE